MAEVNSNTNETVNNDANVEVNNDVNVDSKPTDTSDSVGVSTDVESLMAKIASLEAANRKQKNTIDKLCSEAAEKKRQERAKMSAQEQEEEARKEAEQALKDRNVFLENFYSKTLAKERYQMQGMDVELATKAAEAEIDGNMDELSAIQKQYSDAKLKAEKAKWLASRPEVNAGTSASGITKEQFDKMGMVELSKLKRENPEEFNRLASM